MKTALMAASGRRLGDWRRHVKIDLDIQSNRVINKVTGEQAVIPSGMTYSTLNGKNVAVFNASVIGGIQLAHNPAFSPGAGDFTIETLIDVDGFYNEPADSSQLIPLAFWGTWAAPGQTYSIDFGHNTKNLDYSYLGQRAGSTTSSAVSPLVSDIDTTKVAHLVAQRKNGVVYFYRNGVLLGSSAFPASLPLSPAGQPFRIMSRRGGGSGDVWWRFIGKLVGFRFTHAAIYSGSSFQAPSSF